MTYSQTTLSPSEVQLEVDISLYLEQTTLRPLRFLDHAPPVPAKGLRSDLPLPHLPVGGLRKLMYMQCLKKSEFNATVAEYYQGKAPNHTRHDKASRREHSSDALGGVFDYRAWNNTHSVEGNHDIVRLVEDTLMKAAQILHDLDVTTMKWAFESCDRLDDTRQVPTWEPFILTKRSDENDECKVAVFVVPPWLLSPLDISEFTKLYSLQEYKPKLFGNNRQYLETPLLEKSAFLWMMLNDYCFVNNCHRFVLSTYECWVFGGFSDMFRSGYCAEPYTYNTRQPTVLQTLVYWMHSSWECNEAWAPPIHPRQEPSEDRNYDEIPCTFADLVTSDPKASLCIISC